MAYDSKSNIGKQIANPGNPQVGQATVYEQKISSTPLIERQTSSIPLGQNTARQIDLLSMEQFGQNASILRKDLSIIEANAVNTDKEYGVLQADNSYSFSTILSDSITDETASHTQLTSVTIAKSQDASTVKKSMIEQNAITVDAENGILLPHISPIVGNVIYNLQGFGGGLQFKSGTNVVTADTTAILDGNNKMTKNTNTLYFNAGGGGIILSTFRATIVLKDVSPDYRAYLIISDRYSSSKSQLATYDNKTATAEHFVDGGYKDKVINFRIEIEKLISGTWTSRGVIVSTNTTDDSDDEWDNVEAFKMWIPSAYSDVEQHELPECDLRFEAVFSDGSVKYGSWSIDKSDSSSKSVFYKINNIGNIFDWSYYRYAMGKTISGPTQISCATIGSGVSDNVLIGTNADKVFGFSIGGIDTSRKSMLKFYKLINVSNRISIGIIERENNYVQIGIRYGNDDNYKYVTAIGDLPVGITLFNVSELSVIRFNDYSIDFTVNISGKNKYYSAFTLDNIEGNKLIYLSKDIIMMKSIDIDSADYKDSVDLENTSSGLTSVKARIIEVDDNIYIPIVSNENINLTKKTDTAYPTTFILSTQHGGKNSVLEFSNLGVFVTDNLSFYLPNILSNNFYFYWNATNASVDVSQSSSSNFVHVCKIPSYSPTLNNWETLPLRMEDEYPEIYNNSRICNKFFILGKTGFVSSSGSLYESGTLVLCPNSNKLYLSDPGATIYNCVHLVFVANDNMTSVYTFSELGLVLLYVIEDKVICNPTKISVGVVAVGQNHIWVCTDESVIKIWSSSNTITNASLKTKLDNSAIAILDNGYANYDVLVTTDNDILITTEGDYPSVENLSIATIMINQFGHVSSSTVNTSLKSMEFIDANPNSDLVVVDNVNKTFNRLLKTDIDTNGDYIIQSNQQIEMYQETMFSELILIKVFAKGNGNIDLYLNGSLVDSVSVNSLKYEEYRFNVNTPMNMIDYKLVVSNNVKMMQRIIGIIIVKEEYYG